VKEEVLREHGVFGGVLAEPLLVEYVRWGGPYLVEQTALAVRDDRCEPHLATGAENESGRGEQQARA